MNQTPFTYLGDLVGMKSHYLASPEGAYNYLNFYYNTAFEDLGNYYRNSPTRKVQMFSDTLIVTGDDPAAFVQAIAPIYSKLILRGLLLRGAMVQGLLKYDFRITEENFKKFLPDTDVLARASGLESRVKGARLIVEHELAKEIIHPREDWQISANCTRDRDFGEDSSSVKRSLVPLKDGEKHFEVLYPVVHDICLSEIERVETILTEMKESVSKDVQRHYSSTLKVFRLSKRRLIHHNTLNHV